MMRPATPDTVVRKVPQPARRGNDWSNMTTETKRPGFAEIPLSLHARRPRSAHGTVIEIRHQGTQVLLLLDSGEHVLLTLAEARRVIEQTKKNVVGWVATHDSAKLTLVEEVTA
jgi:hypothetical protein